MTNEIVVRYGEHPAVAAYWDSLIRVGCSETHLTYTVADRARARADEETDLTRALDAYLTGLGVPAGRVVLLLR